MGFLSFFRRKNIKNTSRNHVTLTEVEKSTGGSKSRNQEKELLDMMKGMKFEELFDLNYPDTVIDFCTRAIEIGSASGGLDNTILLQLYHNRGKANLLKEQYIEALNDFEKAKQLNSIWLEDDKLDLKNGLDFLAKALKVSLEKKINANIDYVKATIEIDKIGRDKLQLLEQSIRNGLTNKNWQQAIVGCSKIIDFKILTGNSLSLFYFQRALAYERSEMVDEAIYDYKYFLRLFKEDPMLGRPRIEEGTNFDYIALTNKALERLGKNATPIDKKSAAEFAERVCSDNIFLAKLMSCLQDTEKTMGLLKEEGYGIIKYSNMEEIVLITGFKKGIDLFNSPISELLITIKQWSQEGKW